MKPEKERATRVAILSVFGFAILVAFLMGPITKTRAETTTYRVTQYDVHLDSLRVGDKEAHVIALFSRKGLAHLENGEVADYTTWGTADLIRGKGLVNGYATLTYNDGSVTVSRLHGTTERGMVNLSGEFTIGTGRFAGINGTMTVSGKSLMPFAEERGTTDDGCYEITATYSVPSRETAANQ